MAENAAAALSEYNVLINKINVEKKQLCVSNIEFFKFQKSNSEVET